MMIFRLLVLFMYLTCTQGSALDLRENSTNDILDRMHNDFDSKKNKIVNVRKKALKSVEKEIAVKDEVVSLKNSANSMRDVIIWQKNSKKYISKKQYKKVLKEFIIQNYSKEIEQFESDKAEIAKNKKMQRDKLKAQKKKKAEAKKKKKAEARTKAKKKKRAKARADAKKRKKAELKAKKKQKAEEKANKKKVEQEKARVKKQILKDEAKKLKAKKTIPKVATVEKIKSQVVQEAQQVNKTKNSTENLKASNFKKDGVFIVSSNNTMWADSKSIKEPSLTWEAANEFCNNLTVETYNNWRLPTKDELSAIVDTSRKPAINKKFKNVKSSAYWSVNDYKNSKYYAWVLHFDSGALGSYSKGKKSFVKCIRDIK